MRLLSAHKGYFELALIGSGPDSWSSDRVFIWYLLQWDPGIEVGLLEEAIAPKFRDEDEALCGVMFVSNDRRAIIVEMVDGPIRDPRRLLLSRVKLIAASYENRGRDDCGPAER